MTILSQYRIYPTAGGNQTVWSTTLPIVSSTGGAITSSSTGILETIEISNLITAVTSAQSPYTALLTAGTIACNTSAGALTVNLPDATLVLNCIYYFTNTGSNSITIVPFGTQTIDGSTSYVLLSTGNLMIALQSYDGGVWTQYIDASTADLELTVNSTSIIKNKTITDFTNNVVGFLRPGNMIVVDSIYGTDLGASRGGLPFATLSMALTLAQSGDTIWLLPGTQTLTTPVILATGVSIIGINNKTCIINYTASVTTTMFTMGTNTRIDNVTINLTSLTSNITLTGILFPALTAESAKISSSVINVTNITTGIIAMYGVWANGYRNLSDDETPAIRATTINVSALSAALGGSCRGLYVSWSSGGPSTNQMYVSNCNILTQTNNASVASLASSIYGNGIANNVILYLHSSVCKTIGLSAGAFDYNEVNSGKIIISAMKTQLNTLFYNNNLICNNGTFTCSGNISTNAAISSVGNITSSTGNIACTTGTITSGGNISTNGAINSVGDIISSAGNLVCTAGTISSGGNISTNAAISSVGNITITTGNLACTTGTITSGGNISTNAAINCVGNITSTTGNFFGNLLSTSHVSNIITLPFSNFIKGTGAGTAGTISAAPATVGNDAAGMITVIVSGTSTANAAIVTVTFSKPYTSIPFVRLSPGNAATSAIGTTKTAYVVPSLSNFIITGTATALSAGTYKWYYSVIQ
jgi:hypothetical protein